MSADRPVQRGDVTARVRALAEAAERARFAGASPRMELPADATADEVTARTLVAERLGLPLVLDGQTYHLHEQRAEDGLRSAQAALRTWSFGEAERRLDRASAVAVGPALQQRLSLWKLLVTLVRRLVRASPDGTIRGDPARPVLDLLDAADLLPEPERAHYRAEIQRLVAADATARRDPASVERALWYLVRARLALAADEPLAALLWCVRLARLHAARLPDDPYLTDLLAQARQYVLLALGELEGEAAETARQEAGSLQAWDVYRALAVHLGTALGLDLQREAARLAIAPYRDADA